MYLRVRAVTLFAPGIRRDRLISPDDADGIRIRLVKSDQ